MSKLKDVTGKVFGRLTVLSRGENYKGGRATWNCVCDCGKETNVLSCNLLHGKTLSCGCLHRDVNTTHGQTANNNRSTRIYRIWQNMKQRCYNKKLYSYKSYGGRGIKVCDEWLKSFICFYDWSIANGYEDRENVVDENGYNTLLQIDRIDNDGDYCPKNCRWVTSSKNIRNRSTSKLDKHKIKKIKEMKKAGFSRHDIANRFDISVYTVDECFKGRTWRDID